GFRSRDRPGEPGWYLRRILHHQARRPGHGSFDLPCDHRGAWRSIMGDRRARRGALPVHLAGPHQPLDTCMTVAGATPSLGNKRPRRAKRDNTAADGALTVRAIEWIEGDSPCVRGWDPKSSTRTGAGS